MKLQVKNIIKKFNTTIAVNDISFEIQENKTLGLLGPNGCGKTTTIGMLLGLITPTSGNIFINEQELNYKNHQFLKPKQVVYQKPYFVFGCYLLLMKALVSYIVVKMLTYC